MRINVPEEAIEHFWEEPSEGSWEFWAFVWPVKAKVGDPIYFYYRKSLIASAIVAKIEKPGHGECERTGKFKNRWKVYWKPESFKDERKLGYKQFINKEKYK